VLKQEGEGKKLQSQKSLKEARFEFTLPLTFTLLTSYSSDFSFLRKVFQDLSSENDCSILYLSIPELTMVENESVDMIL
jgi:hypothetical protein